MSMIVNHNMMAMNAARNLGSSYGKLYKSVQRMSSGLRINNAADDAAGLAIREMMRADIATTQQGIRNAADAISMIQTADGGLAIIDEKLTRMKELAQQAATGTYTTIQREIINSEYQAMAAEIDRIANATNFNGIKLLDGSVSNQHNGRGMKIHFGLANNPAEDYYFINIGDTRATSSTGLRVGGDAKNDIWAQGGAANGPDAGPGCCAGGFPSLTRPGIFTSGEIFSFGYNWDWKEDEDVSLLTGKYLSGRYAVTSSDSLADLVSKVNRGSQSRVGLKIDGSSLNSAVVSGNGTVAICLGDEAYFWGSARVVNGYQETVFDLSAVGPTGFYTNSGNGAIYASGALASALSAAGVRLSGNIIHLPPGFNQIGLVAGSASAAVASALPAYQSAINNILATFSATGTVTLSVSAGAAGQATAAQITGVTTVSVSAAAAASGLTKADGSWSADGILHVDTGVWVDGRGNWTTSGTIATQLGSMIQLRAIVTVTSAGVATANVSLGGLSSAISAGNFSPANIGQAIRNLATSLVNDQRAFNPEAVKINGTVGPPPTLTVTANDLAAHERLVKVGGIVDESKQTIQIDDNSGSLGGGFSPEALASAINHNSASQFWAMTEIAADGGTMVYVFHKEGGDNNQVRACEVGGRDPASRDALKAVNFENVGNGEFHDSGTTFSLGGEKWGTLSPVQTKSVRGHEGWNVTLNGRDVGKERDLWIANPGELTTPGLDEQVINGLDRDAFVEVQNAADGNWAGAEVRTQSAAQAALDALTQAIVRKDKVRADLGAMQNRLENTITNLEIQTENLQASESRISDVDVAQEMTEFTKNNVMVQAGVSMLAQANSMSQLVLSLLG